MVPTETSPVSEGTAPQPAATRIIHRAAHVIGLDRAVGFTVSGRIVQGLGSVVNVLLILHFLTLPVQGYYYALWSVVALQSGVSNLGFRSSFSRLRLMSESVSSSIRMAQSPAIPLARIRLASLLQRTVRWYSVACLLMGAALLPGGMRFFSLHQDSRTNRAYGSGRCA